jgi:dCTP deaminase
MSLLLHEDIEELLNREQLTERLIVTPLLDRRSQIGPSSLDLRLGTEFIEPPSRHGALDLTEDHVSESWEATVGREERMLVPLGNGLVLHPGHLVLGCTLEFVRLPNDIGGQVLSRSSWGRIGLVVATAVTMQPGWTGMITLELVNQGALPITLYPGLRVAQLVLWRAARSTEYPYGALSEDKYKAPLGPQRSRLSREIPELKRIERVAQRLGVHAPGSTSLWKSATDGRGSGGNY